MKRPVTAATSDRDAPLLYTVPDVCKKLAVSRATAYRLIATGRLRIVNIGNGRTKTRIRADDLAAFIDAATSK